MPDREEGAGGGVGLCTQAPRVLEEKATSAVDVVFGEVGVQESNPLKSLYSESLPHTQAAFKSQ